MVSSCNSVVKATGTSQASRPWPDQFWQLSFNIYFIDFVYKSAQTRKCVYLCLDLILASFVTALLRECFLLLLLLLYSSDDIQPSTLFSG